MANETAVVESVARKLQNKKAKMKALRTEPADTDSRPLDPKMRRALEATLNADLKKVRIHTGGNVAEVARELRAKAFTIGNNIYFAKPGDAKKAKLVAHEVVHALQQGPGDKLPKAKGGKVLVSK